MDGPHEGARVVNVYTLFNLEKRATSVRVLIYDARDHEMGGFSGVHFVRVPQSNTLKEWERSVACYINYRHHLHGNGTTKVVLRRSKNFR